MLWILTDRCQRDLVRAECAFDGDAIHFLGAGPSLGRAKDNHGPDGLFLEAVLASLLLNSTNLVIAIFKRLSEELMDDFGIIALDKVGVVATAYIKSLQVCVAGASLGGWPRDFVSIEMKDRQDGTVSDRIDEVDRLPASFQWTGLGLAISDNAGHNQVWIVEGRAECMNQRIAKLSAFVHGIRHVRAAVAGHATRSRELAEHEPQAVFIVRDLRVNLGVRAFEVGAGIERRAPVSRTRDVDDVRIMLFDQPVQMNVDKVLAWRCSPVTEQPGLDLLCLERRAKQGIVKEVDLADAKIVSSAPVAIHLVQHLGRERSLGLWGSFFALAVGRNRGRQAHVEDEPGGVAKLIEVLAEGLRRLILVNFDWNLGSCHRNASFLVLRNCSHIGSGSQISGYSASTVTRRLIT